jgi:hypothetical protein
MSWGEVEVESLASDYTDIGFGSGSGDHVLEEVEA